MSHGCLGLSANLVAVGQALPADSAVGQALPADSAVGQALPADSAVGQALPADSAVGQVLSGPRPLPIRSGCRSAQAADPIVKHAEARQPSPISRPLERIFADCPLNILRLDQRWMPALTRATPIGLVEPATHCAMKA